MTRYKKPGLITNTPLEVLARTDFEKVKSIDPRYSNILPRGPVSWDRFRRRNKPYTICYDDGFEIEIISNTRSNAVELAKKQHGGKIVRISVEYLPGLCKDLKTGICKKGIEAVKA